MYCRHCGKQLSDEAIMCPECGTPTRSTMRSIVPQEIANDTPVEPAGKGSSLGAIGFFLSVFAFVTGIIFGAFLYVFYTASLLVMIVGSTTIIPGLAGVSICMAALKTEKGAKKALPIVGIVLAGIALLFLFLTACILCA